MTPAQLTRESFSQYPPEGRGLAVEHIELLRKQPPAFLPLFLREVIGYDWKFPVERKELEHQFSYLDGHAAATGAFAQLRIPAELQALDWLNSPAVFSEQLSAHLWASHQIDAFRKAAVEYVAQLNASATVDAPAMPRLAVVMVGQGAAGSTYRLFRKLRRHGVYYSRVNAEGGRAAILDVLAARSAKQPLLHAHWYIDGGVAPSAVRGVTAVSYASLAPARALLQSKIHRSFESGMGSEALRSELARMQPGDIGLDGGSDSAMSHFQLSLLAEGSGTQIYSTTFVQWAAREALRRAQPLTLVARFAPRQRESSMREQLAEASKAPVADAAGSLIDADIGAYYTWLNMQRLSGAADARFVVWFEDQAQAVVVAPGASPGTENQRPVTVAQLLAE